MYAKTSDKGYRNSIAPNVLTDDATTLNYLALAYCIAGCRTSEGIEYPGISTSCRSFGLYDYKEKNKRVKITKGKPNINKRIRVKAVNVFTGEEKEFLGNGEASKYTGVHKGTVGYYTSGRATKKAHTKEGWRFEKIK